MNAHEDGIQKSIGKRGAVLEGNKDITRAGEAHGVAVLLQQSLGAEDDIQCGLLLDPTVALGPAVVSSMACIEDHSPDGVGILDKAGAHDRLDDFRDIHR